MKILFNIMVVVKIIGILDCMILAFINLFQKQRVKKDNKIFSILMITACIAVIPGFWGNHSSKYITFVAVLILSFTGHFRHYLQRKKTFSKPVKIIQEKLYVPETSPEKGPENPVIGLFVNNFFNEYSVLIWEGVKRAAAEKSTGVICFVGGSFNNPYFDNNQKNSIYKLASREYLSGILAISDSIGSYIKNEELKLFFDQFQPMPVISMGVHLDGIPGVYIDNETGMRNLMNHLIIDHECRNIAFIRGFEGSTDAEARFKVYKEVLAEHAISLDESLIIYNDRNIGPKAVKKLFGTGMPGVDALIGLNDSVAIEVMKELAKQGIRVPEDILIAGFDDIFESRYLTPPLTTIRQPCVELGYRSARNLFAVLQNRPIKESIVLESEFVIRGSCGCGDNRSVSAPEPPGIKGIDFERQIWVVKKRLSSVIEAGRLQQIIREEFPFIGVNSCWIALYSKNDGSALTKNSNLIAGYNSRGPHRINPGKHPFHIKDIITENTQGEGAFFVYSLNYKTELLGFIVYEIEDNREWTTVDHIVRLGYLCEELTAELGSTLKSIKLYNQIRKQAVNLLKDDMHKPSKYQKIKLSEDQAKTLFRKLLIFMEHEKPYIEHNLSLPQLAERVGISRNHLSFIINTYSKVNFFNFINSYRIERAKYFLQKSRDEKLNILNIAYNSGFKSKSTFNKIFKEYTLETPGNYRNKYLKN